MFLTEKETMMLKALPDLARNHFKGEPFVEVWGYQNMLATHTLETHIYRLRKKMLGLRKPQSLKHRGYRLVKRKVSQTLEAKKKIGFSDERANFSHIEAFFSVP